MRSVVWADTDTLNQELVTIDIGSELTSHDTWSNKISGFRSIRGTAVIKVTLNANPFQQGALLLTWMPCYSNCLELYKLHKNSIQARSQLPGMRMQTCHHEATIRIPYVAPTTHYDLANTTNPWDWARFVVSVYSPLKTGATGNTTAQCSVFLSFEDVELEAPMFPQAGGNVSRRTIRKRGRRFVGEEEASVVTEDGPLSKTLGAVQSAAVAVSQIPLLSSIAGPVGWAAGLAKHVSSYFGWSKPLDESGISRMMQMFHAFSYNPDSKDLSQPLSLMAQNKLQVMSGVPGHDYDEMSIDFIKKQWCYIGTLTITPSTTGNVNYYDLQPNLYAVNVNVPNQGITYVAKQHSSISFLSEMFQVYRGSMKFKFRFIKTEFHTGTLAIAYLPAKTTDTTITADQLSYLHTEVVDISEIDEITLTFPYADPATYLDKDSRYGRVFLYWVNELRAPETVCTDIDIIVEVAGADDLEFAIPTNVCPQPMYTQAGEVIGDCVQLEGGIGGSSTAPCKTSEAVFSIGEQVKSVLQLMKAYSRIVLAVPTIVAGTVCTSTSGSINFHQIGSLCAVSAGTSADQPAPSGIYGDYINTFAMCYAFRRGSVRVRAVTTPTDATYRLALVSPPPHQWITDLAPDAMKGGFTTWTLTGVKNIVYKFFAQSASHGGWSVQIPFYSTKPFVPNIPVTQNVETNSTNYPPTDLPNHTLAWYTEDTAPSESDFALFRAAGEDFQLIYWIGVPLMSAT